MYSKKVLKQASELLKDDVLRFNLDMVEFKVFEAELIPAGGGTSSLGVRIPMHIIKEKGVKAGDRVRMAIGWKVERK